MILVCNFLPVYMVLVLYGIKTYELVGKCFLLLLCSLSKFIKDWQNLPLNEGRTCPMKQFCIYCYSFKVYNFSSKFYLTHILPALYTLYINYQLPLNIFKFKV